MPSNIMRPPYELEENDRQRMHVSRTQIILDRGRRGLPDTEVKHSFTKAQLDRRVPLAEEDLDLLKDSCPPLHVRLLIERRIALAQCLKYGKQLDTD